MKDNQDQKESQTVYELAYLILPSIAEDRLSAVVDSIKAIIAKAGGSEIAGEDPFIQDLSYTMNKTVGASRYVVNEAYLGWIKFEATPEAVLGIKIEVENMGEILRALLIKAPRETTFTFAEARKALEEKNAPVSEGEGEEVVPSAPEEAVVE